MTAVERVTRQFQAKGASPRLARSLAVEVLEGKREATWEGRLRVAERVARKFLRARGRR